MVCKRYTNHWNFSCYGFFFSKYMRRVFFFKVHAKVEDCWRSRGDTNITESVQSYVYPLQFWLFSLLLLKEISSISSNRSKNQATCKDRMLSRLQEGYTYYWTGPEICVSPVFLFSCWWKYRGYHLTQLVTQQGLRQESNNMQRWNVVALAGGYTYHWTGAGICVSPLYFWTFWVISCWMKFCESYLFNATSDVKL